MKKVVAMSLASMCIMSLTGCGNAKYNAGDSNNGNMSNIYIRDVVKTSDEALKLLKEGNERFFGGGILDIDYSSDTMGKLKEGQEPFAVVVSCSDSRVVSPYIFNQGLGDIFEVKTAGNVVDKNALGSIEYGVDKLGAKVIVVMGHEHCGAVSATVDNKKLDENSDIDSIIEKIKPSVEKVKKTDTQDVLEESVNENVRAMKDEILKNKVIKAKVDSGEVKIVTARYNLDGKIDWDI